MVRLVETWIQGTLLLLASLFAVDVARAAEPSAPVQVIDKLHTGMLDVMREAEKSTFAQRAERLTPILDGSFDLDFMARKSLGKSFESLSPDDQKKWIATFRRFMVANYAGRFTGYSGQKFETLGEEPAAQDTVLVRTRLIDPGAENMDLGYRLRKIGSGWKVIDVYLKGTVSELALRRSDFTAILDRKGFPALVESVDQKIADLEAGKVK